MVEGHRHHERAHAALPLYQRLGAFPGSWRCGLARLRRPLTEATLGASPGDSRRAYPSTGGRSNLAVHR